MGSTTVKGTFQSVCDMVLREYSADNPSANGGIWIRQAVIESKVVERGIWLLLESFEYVKKTGERVCDSNVFVAYVHISSDGKEATYRESGPGFGNCPVSCPIHWIDRMTIQSEYHIHWIGEVRKYYGISKIPITEGLVFKMNELTFTAICEVNGGNWKVEAEDGETYQMTSKKIKELAFT